MQSEMAEEDFPADIRDYSSNDTNSNANVFVDQVQDEVWFILMNDDDMILFAKALCIN